MKALSVLPDRWETHKYPSSTLSATLNLVPASFLTHNTATTAMPTG
jgi:hypothetical protein